jgi:GntR family transcriptional repressor for pyruvate dehydrogenase complex
MREALQFLVALGHIETRHGGGCFVRAATTDPEFMRKWWIDWVERHRSKILETIEVRLACETFAAELAARRAGPNELSQLVEALRIMRGALVSNDPTRFVQSDFAFHDAPLTAASNSALRNLVVTMGKDLVPNRAALLSLPGRMEKSFAKHSAVYTAVQAGDVVAAAAAMRKHLESVRDDIIMYLLNDQKVTSDQLAEPGNFDQMTGQAV